MSSRNLNWNGLLLNLIIYSFLIATSIHIVISIYQIIITTAPDFSVFYIGSKELLLRNNPYLSKNLFTGIGYPIFTLILFYPFSILPYNISQAIFIFLSSLSIPLSVYLSLLILNWKIKLKYFFLLTSCSFLMFPVKFTLGMGQSNNIVLLILLSALYIYRKGKIEYSGMIFALAALLKPITGFLLLYFLIKGKFRLFIIFALALFIFIGLSIIVYGLDYYIYYFKNIIPPLFNLTDREIYYNQGLMGLISRLTSDNNSRLQIYYIFSFLIFVFFCFLVKRIKEISLGFSIFIVLLVIFDSLSWQHHFAFLIFPFIVTLKYIRNYKNYFLLIMLLFSYLLISLNIPNPQNYDSIILKSHVFIGSVFLLLLLAYISNYSKKGIR